MLEVQIPENKTKIEQQIKALEYQLEKDVNAKDKEIHQQALTKLKNKLTE